MTARPEHMDAQPIPGEACTELGFERSPAPRIPRLGAAGRRHCWVIKHQAWITAAAAMAAFALLVWAAK